MKTLTATLCTAFLAGLAVSATASPGLRSMRLLDATSGWVLAGDHLLWTSSGGMKWSDITPPADHERTVLGAFFLDRDNGWVMREGASRGILELARTSDSGQHWTLSGVAIGAHDAAAIDGSAALDFTDAAHGWAMLKLTSSSNFSLGILLATSDGGATWTKLPSPPLGDAVRFVTVTDGWIAGGPAGDGLFVTRDGGQTWTRQQVASGGRYSLPEFGSAERGTLPVTYTGLQGETTAIYRTQDGGHTWQYSGVQPGVAGLNGKAWESARAALPTKAAVLAADFRDSAQGWLLVAEGHCSGEKSGCRQDQTLMATGDSGGTWHDITPVAAGFVIPDSTTIGSGQGFDKCAISPAGNMQTWFSDSPYRYSNVYIGGSNRACAQSGLNTSWVSQVVAQGWRLVPTWVGLQDPCSSCSSCSKFSTDSATAQAQGAQEAKSANSAAGALGLTGAAIYYDLEEYTGGGNCSTSAQAFVNGWVSQLHALGDVAGVYGAAANAQSDWAGIANSPDDIWIALWNGQDTVWNLSPIPNSEWANNQRAHQYQGGHNETYGGVTFSIDNDVLDCAVSPTGSTPPPPAAWTGIAMAGTSTGYWTVKNDGGVFSYNGAHFYGSMGATPLNAPMVGMSSFPAGTGYWEVGADGGVFAFGASKYHGSLPGSHIVPNKPVVGIAGTADGKGYWLVAADGGIFAYGDAVFYGSMGGKPLSAPVVGMARTPDGKGYWLVGADGGLFAFGDAGYYGSLPGLHVTPNKPITGIASTPDGKGYWMIGGDGGIFAFGDAGFHGSFVGKTAATIVGIAYDNAGGYIVVASDNTVYSAN